MQNGFQADARAEERGLKEIRFTFVYNPIDKTPWRIAVHKNYLNVIMVLPQLKRKLLL